MNRDFWAGKRVLVTGHTGFKGGWLSIWLGELGAEVIGYSLPPVTDPAMFTTARVGDGIVSLTGDVCDLDALTAVVRDHRPEIIIHMAAQALVHTAYDDPVRTFTTNVLGTLHVLEAARRDDIPRVVVSITSDKCYDNVEWVWGYRENDRLGGHDPYSASKACAELLISAYRDSYFLPDRQERTVSLASTRAGNVIGGGDWSKNRLVPDTIRAITAGEPVLIRQPDAVRPWQFVLEPLRGYLDLAERLWNDGERFAGPWNFGPDPEQIKPVKWIVSRITELWGGGARWDVDGVKHPHEHHFLKLDTAKAKSELGWAPRLDLETTIEWIVEWHQRFEAGDDMRAVTEEQVARYMDLGTIDLTSPTTAESARTRT